MSPVIVKSVRALARALGRDPSQLRRMLKVRPEFPRVPDGFDVEKVKAYLTGNSKYRKPFESKSPDNKANVTAPTPSNNEETAEDDPIEKYPGDAIRVTVQMLLDESYPFRLTKFLGPTLIAEQTVADLQSLADHLNFAQAAVLLWTAEDRGEKGLREHAPASYYDQLWDECDKELIVNKMIEMQNEWAKSRFIAYPGWLKLLADPVNDDPPKNWMKGVKPLFHRR